MKASSSRIAKLVTIKKTSNFFQTTYTLRVNTQYLDSAGLIILIQKCYNINASQETMTF